MVRILPRMRMRRERRPFREGLWVVCLAPSLTHLARGSIPPHGKQGLPSPSPDDNRDNILADWRTALQRCESEICDVNVVDEQPDMAEICGAIPVRSDNGGAGRTTVFGRTLWCAARFGTGPIIDLYAGRGDTVALFADGLQHREAERKIMITFEISKGSAIHTMARLRRYNVAVLEVTLSKESVTRERIAKIMSWTPPSSVVGAIVFIGSTSTLVAPEGQQLLGVVCSMLPKLSLVLLDPDIEMGNLAFAADWRILEKFEPQVVAMYNTNLPGGTGWVRERLLHLGTYAVVVDGHNDGGEGELDELLCIRAWSLLQRVDSGASPPGRHHKGRQTENVADVDAIPKKERFPRTVQEAIQHYVDGGAKWVNATFRSNFSAGVTKIFEPVLDDLLPVAVKRPTFDLLPPPTANTNSHDCLADIDERHSSQQLRVPCFLTCSGPNFDPSWSKFRASLIENMQQEWEPNMDIFLETSRLLKDITYNDSLLILGRSRFISRLRHEFTNDEHLQGFCLYGIVNALFIRARNWLDITPREFMFNGQRQFAPDLALEDLEMAFTLLSDSNTKSGIEFSFLENSAWPVKLEEIIINFEKQRSSLGAPFQVFTVMGPSLARVPLGMVSVGAAAHAAPAKPTHTSLAKHFKLCGVGDHLTATFDAMLMVEHSWSSVSASNSAITFERELLGRFCPAHAGQLHQCRQRCQLLGVGCGNGDEDNDPIARWLDGVIHPESLDELAFDLLPMTQDLGVFLQTDPRLVHADIFVCSHPTILCVLLAAVSEQTVFTHASSTLLYGLYCDRCGTGGHNWHSTLRLYNGDNVQRYLNGVRSLFGASSEHSRQQHVFFTEGRFLAEQIAYQTRMTISWVPPLALYAEGRWTGAGKRSAVFLRSRFFVTLMGELLRSLMREIISINKNVAEFTFLGVDSQFDEQWLTLEQIAGFGAAVLYPNDVHQRTFHEAYRMGLPLFMPDALGLYRSQRAANWGYTSYGGGLFVQEGVKHRVPWWNSFNATPDIVLPFQQMADWEQFPHVQRFASLPGLVDQVSSINLEEVSTNMLEFHQKLSKETLIVVAEKVLAAFG